MEMVPDDKAKGMQTPIWEEYKKIVNDAEKKEVYITRTPLPNCCLPASEILAFSIVYIYRVYISRELFPIPVA